MVCELFATPRVTLCASRAGLMSRWSIDHLITDPITGAKWDLTDRNQQKRILKKVEIGEAELDLRGGTEGHDQHLDGPCDDEVRHGGLRGSASRREILHVVPGRQGTVLARDRCCCSLPISLELTVATVDLCTYGLKAHDEFENGAGCQTR